MELHQETLDLPTVSGFGKNMELHRKTLDFPAVSGFSNEECFFVNPGGKIGHKFYTLAKLASRPQEREWACFEARALN